MLPHKTDTMGEEKGPTDVESTKGGGGRKRKIRNGHDAHIGLKSAMQKEISDPLQGGEFGQEAMVGQKKVPESCMQSPTPQRH